MDKRPENGTEVWLGDTLYVRVGERYVPKWIVDGVHWSAIFQERHG